jgi:hypothetical protein
MKGDRIPDTDHIARLCYGKGISEGQILGAAFLPRVKDIYLSVDWLECLQCPDRASEIVELRKRYAKRNLTPKKKDQIAILNTGDMCAKVARESEDRRQLNVSHEPQWPDDSHSGIWGISCSDMMIAELILLTVLDIAPATEPS